jgi:catechol 2,3-dioxygenase-like lactoylglutathione lyase family enzyme
MSERDLGRGITGLDHVSLPTRDVEGLAAFYSGLGVVVDGLEQWRAGDRMVVSLLFDDLKIHLHTPRMLEHVGEPWFVRADEAVPGCGDLCFEWRGGIPALLEHLADEGIAVIEGPAARIGGRHRGTAEGVSVYVRDPDANLVELISYDPDDRAEVHDV